MEVRELGFNREMANIQNGIGEGTKYNWEGHCLVAVINTS